jgi:hypothetical protein
MKKISGPFAISFNSEEMDGKMKVLWVTFEEEIVPMDDRFEKRQFQLLPQGSPYVEALRKVVR